MKDTVIITSVSLCFIGLVFGAAEVITFDKCSYANIAARINPGYVITCELFEPRWKR